MWMSSQKAFQFLSKDKYKQCLPDVQYMSNSSPVLKKAYDPLFGKDKSGKTRVWIAAVYDDSINGIARAVIQHGVHGGKLQTDSREYSEGKNRGKKNETSAFEQCVLETDKKHRDKIEKEGYSTSLETKAAVPLNRKIFPMLANKYESSASNKRAGIVFPCYVQPKLDGLRCVIYAGDLGSAVKDGDLASAVQPVYQSRTGGIFTTLQHLTPEISEILRRCPGIVLDGELYTKEIPFEELAGIIKKKSISSEEDRAKIREVQYHIYDLIVPDTPFQERLSLIQLSLEETPRVKIVPTYLAHSSAEFKEKFAEFVEQGYEGIMLRNAAGLYKENYRSNDLMKYKEFLEAEYPIVDFKEASGRDAGTVIWECETPEGRRFSVRPRGTVEVRKQWFQSAKSIVGKQLTVIFQELSEMGVPRFPVGKAIRDGY
jgi:ATP-dependent DNA ligase